MITQFDQPYPIDDGFLKFDLFRPDNSDGLPAVICIHGGGWISGSREEYHDVAAKLAEEGFVALCPQYRLAPLHPFPTPVNDLRLFVRHLKNSAASLGLDATRIGALGNSAGGHLATMLGVSVDAAERVDAVVDICGITDLTDPQTKHLPISWSFLGQFMPVPYLGNEALYREASPVYHVSKETPPFLIIHGEDDDVVPISQSEELVKVLAVSNIPYEFHRLPHEGHSFSYECWTSVEKLFTAFLKENLK